MPPNKARTLRNPTRPKATLSVNSSGEVVWAKIAAHEPAGSARNNTVASVEAPPQALYDAIEDQCVRLLNVLGAVHCMSIGMVTQTEDPAPEISAAFGLLEGEIDRVVAGLKEIALRAEMRGIAAGHPDTSDAGTHVINRPATDFYAP
jgi:hypothetical protein